VSAPETEIDIVVEIAKGSRNKYEYDAALGMFRLDRVLYSSVHYPAEYGFIPDTLAPDGDLLDAMVLSHEPTFPGCLVPARPIGLLDVVDDGVVDHKIIAVPTRDPRFEAMRDLRDLPGHWQREIEHFFASYKLLETGEGEITGWEDARAAWDFILRCRSAWEAAARRRPPQ
jgi:inorganic pyrophosphatase